MKLYQRAGFVLCWALLGAIPAFASQNVDEVIKMTKGGTTAEVLVAYIEKSNTDPRLTADDLAAMEAANVPAAAIEAMLAKEKATAGIETSSEVTVAPSADNSDISYFYTSMSNDGEWTNDTEYGWSWSPRIAHGNTEWRPYVDNGYWVYTNDGWYWNSGYSWGWAAFHYGRWSHRGDRWSWHPDNVWGSSWVSWRNNDSHYGWAPLSPRARFGRSGGFDIGITTGDFDLNIGIGHNDYAFVRSNQFFDHDLGHNRVRGNEQTTIYKSTTINNTYVNSNNRTVNQGIPVAAVAVATKREIKPVTIVDNPAKAGEPVAVGAAVEGNQLRVFRPKLAEKAAVDPAAAVARRAEARNARTAATEVKRDAATERQAEKKAEAVKRVTERAAKEPQLKPRPTTRDSVDAKAAVPQVRAPEVQTPEVKVDREPNKAPERREPNRAENVKPRDEAPKHEVKPEPRERADPPARPEPKARDERASKPERTERNEKSEKSDKKDEKKDK